MSGTDRPSGWGEPHGEPGWERPGGPSPRDPGYSPHAGEPGQPGGWNSSPGWSQRPPDVKPGVVPLRPLAFGEILDGAVTTIRRNPRVMLGLSAIVAVVTQLVGMLVVRMLIGEAVSLDDLEETITAEEALDFLATSLGGLAILLFVTWVGTTFLTGMLTVVVGRAVIGQDLTLAETWRHAKRRLPRLFGLTIVYTLIWSAAVWVVLVATISLTASGEAGGAVAVFVFGTIVAGLVGIWLYVRLALSTPALMLETTEHRDGAPVPIGIIESLRRSARLVTGSWWRVFGILLLVLIIVVIVSQVIGIPFDLPATLGDGDGNLLTVTGLSFGALVISTLGGIISATITAPFSAGATALLYVDLRIRREGLDLELARAANVQFPGRSEDYGHGEGTPPGL